MLFRLFTVLAVIALGVSTWILSSPAHRPSAPASRSTVELPGYYLKDTVLTDFDENGKVSIHLEADRIDQVDHGSEVTLSHVRVDYEAPNGQDWRLFGDTAHTEPGGNIIEVSQNVRLQGEGTAPAAGVIVRTDELRYDVAESIVSTKSDVRVEFGEHSLTARGLVANLKERTLRLESKVNGRFQR